MKNTFYKIKLFKYFSDANTFKTYRGCCDIVRNTVLSHLIYSDFFTRGWMDTAINFFFLQQKGVAKCTVKTVIQFIFSLYKTFIVSLGFYVIMGFGIYVTQGRRIRGGGGTLGTCPYQYPATTKCSLAIF